MKLILALCWVLACASTYAQPASPARYSLKENPNALPNAFSGIAFDKSYGELPEEQKADVRSLYVDMGDTDEPPFPIRGYQALYGALSKGAGPLRAEGEFVAHVEIDAQGDAQAIKILKTPDSAVTRFVANIVMVTKFKPAICAGVPCSMGFPIRLTFKLERRWAPVRIVN